MTVVIPTLETERLLLRAWRAEDASPAIAMFMHDPGMEHIGGPNTEIDAWRRVAAMIGHWTLKGFGRFAVEEKASGLWVGYVGLSAQPGFPEIDLGWAIRAEVRGRGYAREAGARARGHAFDTLPVATLASLIAPANAASRSVAVGLGAVRDGSSHVGDNPVEVWRHARGAVL